MKPHHRKQLNADMLSRAMAPWGGEFTQSRILDSAVNVVCEVHHETGPLILRIAHEQHRSRAALDAELAWIEHLAANGMTVCRPVHSRFDRFIESLPAASGEFLVTAFNRAPGRLPSRADLHRSHMIDLGRMIATMHELTSQWPCANRPQWHAGGDRLINSLTSRDAAAGQALREVTQAIQALPRDRDYFGLVHGDVHVGNYHLHGSEIWLYDFDNCGNHWHVSDLGTLWYFSLARTSGSDMDIWRQVSGPMIKAVLTGYMQVRPLSDFWIKQLSLFRRYRALCAYAYKLHSRSAATPSPSRQQHVALMREYAMDAAGSLDGEFA